VDPIGARPLSIVACPQILASKFGTGVPVADTEANLVEKGEMVRTLIAAQSGVKVAFKRTAPKATTLTFTCLAGRGCSRNWLSIGES
jgi:hypothetical protein